VLYTTVSTIVQSFCDAAVVCNGAQRGVSLIISSETDGPLSQSRLLTVNLSEYPVNVEVNGGRIQTPKALRESISLAPMGWVRFRRRGADRVIADSGVLGSSEWRPLLS